MLKVFLLVVLIVSTTGRIGALLAEEIMAFVDEYKYSGSYEMEMTMIITSGLRTQEKTMSILAKGTSALMEFTNPRDQGTRFLKVDDDLWMFFPDAEEIVKISGHLLRQGLMGSDLSYQDLMEMEKLLDLYDFTLKGHDEVEGRETYLVESIAKEGVDVIYHQRLSWIHREWFVPLREELYAKSGRLLKVMEAKGVEKIQDRYFITHMIIEDKLRRDTVTEYVITSLAFDVPIHDQVFTLNYLFRGR